jgi:hypothetical protein
MILRNDCPNLGLKMKIAPSNITCVSRSLELAQISLTDRLRRQVAFKCLVARLRLHRHTIDIRVVDKP